MVVIGGLSQSGPAGRNDGEGMFAFCTIYCDLRARNIPAPGAVSRHERRYDPVSLSGGLPA
jgi:hypothetical protein